MEADETCEENKFKHDVLPTFYRTQIWTMEDGPDIQQRRISKYQVRPNFLWEAYAASDNTLDIFRPDEPPEKHLLFYLHHFLISLELYAK